MKQTRQTPFAKNNPHKTWYVIDANGVALGRLASYIANILQGKHKATYTPHANMGDAVIVLNAAKIGLSGNKRNNKIYYWHTGYPGGIKQRTAKDILEGSHPERVVMRAIHRMLPKGPLSREQLRSLRVYKDDDHHQHAQNPIKINFKSMNQKNTINR